MTRSHPRWYRYWQRSPSEAQTGSGGSGGSSGQGGPGGSSGTGGSGESVAPQFHVKPPPGRQGHVLTIANQKGGVGKTTTAVSLSAALADAGHRVLLLDLDPQGNATSGVGIRLEPGDATVYQALLDEVPLSDVVRPTSVARLDLAPATIDLAGAEIELVSVFNRERRLRTTLEPLRDAYDFVVVDCPPSLGLLTINALTAGDGVLVPIQCEYYALEGLGALGRNVELIQTHLNPDLEVLGYVLTMLDARTRLAQQVVEEVVAHFGDQVFSTRIPRSVRLAEAPGFGEPITVFDPDARGALAYRRLADEVQARLGNSAGSPPREDATA